MTLPSKIPSEQAPKSLMSFIADLWKFLRIRKKLWLLPIILVMVAVGGLLVLAQGSVLAPFLYVLH